MRGRVGASVGGGPRAVGEAGRGWSRGRGGPWGGPWDGPARPVVGAHLGQVDAVACDDNAHQAHQRHEGVAAVKEHRAVRDHLQRVLEGDPAVGEETAQGEA